MSWIPSPKGVVEQAIGGALGGGIVSAVAWVLANWPPSLPESLAVSGDVAPYLLTFLSSAAAIFLLLGRRHVDVRRDDLDAAELKPESRWAFYHDREADENWTGLISEVRGARVVWQATFTGSYAANAGLYELPQFKRLVLLHPQGKQIEFIAAASTKSADQLRQEIVHATNVASQHGVEVRWFDGPILGMVITEPDWESAAIRAEVFVPFGQDRPGFRVERADPLFERLSLSFSRLWGASVSPTETHATSEPFSVTYRVEDIDGVKRWFAVCTNTSGSALTNLHAAVTYLSSDDDPYGEVDDAPISGRRDLLPSGGKIEIKILETTVAVNVWRGADPNGEIIEMVDRARLVLHADHGVEQSETFRFGPHYTQGAVSTIRFYKVERHPE